MRRIVCAVSLLALVGSLPVPVQAGWIAEWQNVSVKSTGERQEAQSSTMTISNGQARLAQPDSITVIDYNKGRFTLMNPQREFFWSGSVDEYIAEMSKTRADTLRQRAGRKSGAPVKAPKVDPGSLPPLTIQKTSETKAIAGHETTKYVVHVDGQLFQELWVAADLNLSKDLDPAKFLTYQQKMSAVRMGKSAGAFNALYRNEEYRKLLEDGFVLRTVTHHIAGSFERTATSIRSEAVPASTFAVPDSYRRVRLKDVLPAGQQG